MYSLNKVFIIGFLGSSPRIQYSQSGLAICKLNVATDESYTSKAGEKIKQTEWHRINAFNRLAEICHTSLTKGSLIYVEGSINSRQWQDKDGNRRYSTEINASKILFLDRRQDINKEQVSFADINEMYNSSDNDISYHNNSIMDNTPFDTVPF